MGWLGGLSERRWIWLVFLLGITVATAFAFLTPVWQAPDEPGHVEYACLLGALRRPITGDDLDLALQREIIQSLSRNNFWGAVGQPRPAELPDAFADDPFLLRSGRQVGDEPLTYYLIPSLICRLNADIVIRVRLMRVFGALLFGVAGLALAWGWSGGQRTALRIVHPAVLMLLPMSAFIAASVNNGGLAAAAAAVTFAAVLRMQRIGWRWRWALVAGAAAVVSLATKKTGAFLALWLAGMALVYGWRSLRRRGWTVRRLLVAGTVILLVVVGVALLPASAPAGWRSAGLPFSVQRIGLGDEGWVVRLSDRSPLGVARVYQSITGSAAEALRGETVVLTAQVRSANDEPAPGRLTVRDVQSFSQTRFTAGSAWQTVTVTRSVAPDTGHVKVALAPGANGSPAEIGSLLIRDVTLRADNGSVTGNLLANPSFGQQARLASVVLAPLEDTWQQFRPRLAGMFTDWQRYPLYTALLFPGFWGNFGWLQRPLPIWLYGALALICLAGCWGSWLVLRDQGAVLRGVTAGWLAAALLALLLALLPMIGRDWQPQGRYLFGALVPVTGLLLIGLDRLMGFDRHSLRANGVLAGAALLCLAGLLAVA